VVDLYVGNTRRKFHNESIHIAGTLDDARAQLIDTITRGVPETTTAESRAAAQAELGSAARTPVEPDMPAPRQDRPWGHIVDVDDRLQSEPIVQHDARSALEQVIDRIAQRERALVKLDQRLADLAARDNANANRHAELPVEPAERSKFADARTRLAAGLEHEKAQQVRLSKAYRKVVARTDDVFAPPTWRPPEFDGPSIGCSSAAPNPGGGDTWTPRSTLAGCR
jgi:hypothetical protein